MSTKARLLARLKPYLRWLPYIGILIPPFLKDSDTALAKWVIIGAAVSVQIWKDMVGNAYAEDKLAQRLRSHLSTLIDEIEAILGTEFKGALRASILRPCDPSSLKIFCFAGDHKAREMTMKWEIGKGVCGVAFARGKMVCGDLREQSAAKRYEDLMDDTGQVPYGVTEEQWSLTRNLETTLAIPICEGNDMRRKWGVLCLDSTASVPPKAADSEIAKTLDTYRRMFGTSIIF